MSDGITFEGFHKIARLSRDIIITEKLDGTNVQVIVTDDGQVAAASRTRLITPEDDNHGFARWVAEHMDELRALGPGRHFGEWWGQGINRKYELKEKRFSLFNVTRWLIKTPPVPPPCTLVPILYKGPFSTIEIDRVLEALAQYGSVAAPGFMDPEGIVVFHTASHHCYKKTIKGDEAPKGLSQ